MDWSTASNADIIAYCRKLDRQRKQEAERIARDLDRVAKEQARQAAVLKKHEEMIRKNTFKLEQAEADIAYLTDYWLNLCALLDIEQNEQAGAIPGSKTDVRCQRKILTLSNQIHSVELRLAKAKYNKSEAELRLA